MRICVMITWREEGRWNVLRYWRAKGWEVDLLMPAFLGPRSPKLLKKISLRLAHFYLPLRAIRRRKRYDALVTWNMTTGAGSGFLKRLFRPFLRIPPLLVRDFHIDPTRAHSFGYKQKLRFLAWAMRAMDLILTTSEAERAIYAEHFAMPVDRFRFLPDSPRSELMDAKPYAVEEYVFAFGNSDRDFDTLVEAARELPLPVKILSQNYTPSLEVPDNVELITDFVPAEELHRLIGSARCCVLPLKDHNVAAGQNTMFEIMLLGRPMVVSSNLATREYAAHRETALFTDPGDAESIREQIGWILGNPDESEAMAVRARDKAASYLDMDAAMLVDLVNELRAGDQEKSRSPQAGGRP